MHSSEMDEELYAILDTLMVRRFKWPAVGGARTTRP